MHQPRYERTPWISGGRRVESTIPLDLAETLGLEGGQPAAVRPILEDTKLTWRVNTDEAVDPDATNVRRIKHREQSDDASEQYTLRFPNVLSAMSGLTTLIETEPVTFEYERANRGFKISPWPPLHPWTLGAPLEGVSRRFGRLVELTKTRAFYFEVSKPHAEALGLEKGDDVAFRFTSHNGALAVAADLSVSATESDGAHTRAVQRHSSGPEGRMIDQYRIYVPRAAVDALEWADANLAFVPHENSLVLVPSAAVKGGE